MRNDDKIKYWFTTEKGVHVPVREGQSKEEALKERFSEPKFEKVGLLDGMGEHDEPPEERGRSPKKKEERDEENKTNYFESGKPFYAIKERSNNTAANSYKGYRTKMAEFREKLKNSPDGTYDYDTGKAVSFAGQKKYQVSFQTTKTEDVLSDKYLTDEQYDAVVAHISKETGSKPYLGKYETLETSFVCNNLDQAMDIAKRYNQRSVWDWETMNERFNPDFDPAENTVKRGK